MASKQYECIIIGAGPGGLVSALYLERYKRKIAVIDGEDSRARWIPRIRNLIGHTKGLTGPELLENLKEQVSAYKTEIIKGTAQVRRKGRGFEVDIGHRILRAKKVILATGMNDIQPPIENYESLRKKGLLGYCPICDGFDHSKDRIGLLVNGSHGLKKISFIAKFSPDLHIIPTKELKLSSHYISTIKKLGAHFHAGQLESLQSQTKPRGLTVKMKNRKPFFVKFAYVALGAVVNASAIQFIKLVRRSKDGHFITDAHQQTSVPGLFAVGDCVHTLSQVSVAVGQAAIAATQVHNDLGF